MRGFGFFSPSGISMRCSLPNVVFGLDSRDPTSRMQIIIPFHIRIYSNKKSTSHSGAVVHRAILRDSISHSVLGTRETDRVACCTSSSQSRDLNLTGTEVIIAWRHRIDSNRNSNEPTGLANAVTRALSYLPHLEKWASS
jgi:hypothetical protein